MARSRSAIWVDEHSNGQEADQVCVRVDSAAKVKRAKDRIASLIDIGCGVRQPRDRLVDLDDWLADLTQLVGDREAANTSADICEEKISTGISENDSSLYAGWLKSIRKRAGSNIAPVGRKGEGRKAKGGKGPKRPKG